MIKYYKEKKNKSEYTVELNQLKKKYNVIELSSIEDIQEKNLYKTLDKETLFVITTGSMSEVRSIKQKELPKFCNVFIYMSADLYNRTILKDKQSMYKEFRDLMIIANPKISKRCIYQLYLRTDKNIEKSIEIINKGVLTVRQLDKIIPPIDINIYASDIILPLLNKKLSRTFMKDLETFINTLTEKGAFYAINKYLNSLYELKLQQLLNTLPKDKEWMEDQLKQLRVNEILNMKLQFNNSSYRLFKVILQERINNVRI